MVVARVVRLLLLLLLLQALRRVRVEVRGRGHRLRVRRGGARVLLLLLLLLMLLLLLLGWVVPVGRVGGVVHLEAVCELAVRLRRLRVLRLQEGVLGTQRVEGRCSQTYCGDWLWLSLGVLLGTGTRSDGC